MAVPVSVVYRVNLDLLDGLVLLVSLVFQGFPEPRVRLDGPVLLVLLAFQE
jgi:hypothetical protein